LPAAARRALVDRAREGFVRSRGQSAAGLTELANAMNIDRTRQFMVDRYFLPLSPSILRFCTWPTPQRRPDLTDGAIYPRMVRS